MNRNWTRRFRATLASVAIGGLLATGALAADKATPKSAAAPPSAAAAGKVNAPIPSNPQSAPSQAAAKNATDTAAPKDASKPQPKAEDNNANAASKNDDEHRADNADPRDRDEKADGQPRNAASPSNAAKPGNADARRNDSEAVRRQTNRPITSDPKAKTDRNAKSQRAARNNANIGLAFGAAGGSMMIASIGPSGYFANAGFQPNDRIISGGGRQFANQAAFYIWLATVQAGQRLPFVISRNGQQQTVYWTPTQQFVQAYAQGAQAGDEINFLGIQLDNQVQDAAVVANVNPNSPAQKAGVRASDVVVAVNGQQVSSPNEFADTTAALPQATAVDLTISRPTGDPAVSRTTHVKIAPRGGQSQTDEQNLTGAAPAATPAPVPAPATSPAPIRGLFRSR